MDILTFKDSQGNILDKGTLINGNGTVNVFDKNGKLITVTFKDGQEQQ